MEKIKKSSNSKERNQTADLLKGLAVIFMVQVHIMELFAKEEVFNSLTGKISLFLGGPPAAPVFMAVMGYFLFRSKKDTAAQIQRGLNLILGGLLLNVGLNFHLLYKVYEGTADVDPFKYIFGADILPLAGFSIIIISLLRVILKHNIAPYIVIAFLTLFVSPSLLDLSDNPSSPLLYIQAFFWGELSWSYFPLFPWLFYPLLGFIFGISEMKVVYKNKNLTVLFLASLVSVILTFNYAFLIPADLKTYYHHDFLFANWVVVFLTGYSILIFFAERFLGSNPVIYFIKWTGRNVTAFYIVQWLIIGNIATAIYHSQNLEQCAMWFIGILMVSSIAVYSFNILIQRKEHMPDKT